MLDEIARVPRGLTRPVSGGSAANVEPAGGFLGDTLLRAEIANVGEGVVVVHLHGEIDTASAPALMRGLLALFALPIQAMTIDLAALTSIDSSGISVLNTVRTTAADRSVTLKLDALPAQARRVLELTGMLSLFELHERSTPTHDRFG